MVFHNTKRLRISNQRQQNIMRHHAYSSINAVTIVFICKSLFILYTSFIHERHSLYIPTHTLKKSHSYPHSSTYSRVCAPVGNLAYLGLHHCKTVSIKSQTIISAYKARFILRTICRPCVFILIILVMKCYQQILEKPGTRDSIITIEKFENCPQFSQNAASESIWPKRTRYFRRTLLQEFCTIYYSQ